MIEIWRMGGKNNYISQIYISKFKFSLGHYIAPDLQRHPLNLVAVAKFIQRSLKEGGIVT